MMKKNKFLNKNARNPFFKMVDAATPTILVL